MLDRLSRLGLLALASLLVQPLAALTFSWTPGSPSVEEVAPGGSVVFLGITREPLGDSQRVTVVREAVPVAGSDTRVLVPWERGEVPPRSVWAAVETGSGAVALSSPSAELVPDTAVQVLPAGSSSLTVADRWLEVLLIRPGGGQWGGTLRDGSPDDPDGTADGTVILDPSALLPFEGSPALAAWSVGDVLITIDLDTLAVVAYQIGGAP